MLLSVSFLVHPVYLDKFGVFCCLQEHVLRSHAQGKAYDRRVVDVRCEEREVRFFRPQLIALNI